ncbi:UPF0325 protein [Duffyella gerundensis]|jgi:hypothetical protein|uniref:UPF0325 protein EM595_0799 n=2 Tax=Erwiniaceae TaxID=1903409 RepID=A0A0U5L1M4_9GAMM|nr:UPF0325 protein [Duffyella gerundensis]
MAALLPFPQRSRTDIDMTSSKELTTMYDNLKGLGISKPDDIDRYSLRQEANNDILKIYFRKDKGEFFAKSVKFKYPRQRKTVVADNIGQGYKEVQEISPNLRYVIDELDQICQRDQVEVDLKRKILDDLHHLESVVAHKIAEIESDLEKLTRNGR